MRFLRLVNKFLAMPYWAKLLRLKSMFYVFWGRYTYHLQEQYITESRFLNLLDAKNLEVLHHRIISFGHPCATSSKIQTLLKKHFPDEQGKIILEADKVMQGEVSLLGSGDIQLGDIHWSLDYKTGISWPDNYFIDISTHDLDRPSDVKFPWELSRLQWLIPVAQAWVLTKEDRYASYAKKILESWIDNNRFAYGVNWTCTMEPAMRVFVWTWFYHVFADAVSWQDKEFRFSFLRCLYLHLKFISHHIEITDINGNHLIADVSALVIGGIFFSGNFSNSNKLELDTWSRLGWKILNHELPLQIYKDGVDFEASTAYHRLVCELYVIAALYYQQGGGLVSEVYQQTMLKMADYIAAYTKPDGRAPLVGDADDARVLPLGSQHINDHRYLAVVIGSIWSKSELTANWQQSGSECLWWLSDSPESSVEISPIGSTAFTISGNYIMRSGSDYVFIDCGPIGLANRGGHGHNDLLSFEATLNGVNLITDSGSYVYTADYKQRNKFRSTSSHNTPLIAGEEINRFISPRNLWFLHGDAQPNVLYWHDNETNTCFRGSHTGYQRLIPPVSPIRSMALDKIQHTLVWKDTFSASVGHSVTIPLQLVPGVTVSQTQAGVLLLEAEGKQFVLEWLELANWEYCIVNDFVATSYGQKTEAPKILWESKQACKTSLTILLSPDERLVESKRKQLLNLVESTN
ncbi:hypothetical protein AB835_08560 [Candidatus Endobugula sertula]|uniref:Uncharacterized protein n=1 Tax=Candidatus Endobugula sertula TaxID=62101 RepID=A0A1D2QPG1_9GAMM|nr:hypothetical protein AB835_08560 [Candidatus Endobugula sertula]